MFKILLLFLCFQVGYPEAPLRDRLNTASKLDKPILTIFSAKWCVPCQLMKNNVIEPMRASGELNSVSVVTVDVDIDKQFTETHLGKNYTIPKILLFFKKDNRWFQYNLTGYQSKEKILQVIEYQRKNK